MRLIRGLWRLLVGVKDALVLLLMLLFFGVLYAALSASPSPTIADGGALLVQLDGALVEQPADPDPLSLLPNAGPVTREYRLRDVVRAIEAAAVSPRVKAVVLDLDRFTGGGQAAIATVGEALDKVRRANKPVIAFATGYTDDGYQLAAHASEVWLDPLGAVLIAGPGGPQLFYKGFLDKIGVVPKIYRVGTFKSAVEPFIRSDQSPESRAANQALADSLWETWLGDVTRARPRAQVAAYAQRIDALAAQGGSLASVARRAGLIDQIGDRNAVGKRIAGLVGPDVDKSQAGFRTIRLAQWIAANPARTDGGAIGVVTIAGNIVDGRASPGTAGGDTIARLLTDALARNELKALVVRVDSPGGSVFASERIRQAILEAKRRGLPVVASMGSVAASGGYWVSTPADIIFAEPSTITGSIGVFGILPTFPGTLEKLGLSADGVATTPLSGQPDVLRGTSPAFDRLFQLSVEDMYRTFIGIVSASRRLPPAQVDGIAQGRVWAGGTARQIRLIDQFGGLDDAIAEAARRAKLDPAKVHPRFIEEQRSVYAQFVESMMPDRGSAPDAFARLAGRPDVRLAGAIGRVSAIARDPAVQAYCVACPVTTAPSAADLATARALLGGTLRP